MNATNDQKSALENNWFDPKTGLLRLDELVTERESFRKIMEDQSASPDEVLKQSKIVINKMHLLEDKLDDEQKLLVADVMAELSVLFVVSQFSQLNELKNL